MLRVLRPFFTSTSSFAVYLRTNTTMASSAATASPTYSVKRVKPEFSFNATEREAIEPLPTLKKPAGWPGPVGNSTQVRVVHDGESIKLHYDMQGHFLPAIIIGGDEEAQDGRTLLHEIPKGTKDWAVEHGMPESCHTILLDDRAECFIALATSEGEIADNYIGLEVNSAGQAIQLRCRFDATNGSNGGKFDFTRPLSPKFSSKFSSDEKAGKHEMLLTIPFASMGLTKAPQKLFMGIHRCEHDPEIEGDDGISWSSVIEPGTSEIGFGFHHNGMFLPVLLEE